MNPMVEEFGVYLPLNIVDKLEFLSNGIISYSTFMTGELEIAKKKSNDY